MNNVLLAHKIKEQSKEYVHFGEENAAYWGAMKMARIKDEEKKQVISDIIKWLLKHSNEYIIELSAENNLYNHAICQKCYVDLKKYLKENNIL